MTRPDYLDLPEPVLTAIQQGGDRHYDLNPGSPVTPASAGPLPRLFSRPEEQEQAA